VKRRPANGVDFTLDIRRENAWLTAVEATCTKM